MAPKLKHKQLPDSAKKKAQRRQFKKVCARVEKHFQEFGTPIVLMALLDGCCMVVGSEKVKREFCKDGMVQKKFLECASPKVTAHQPHQSCQSETMMEEDTIDDQLDFSQVSAKFLRCFIAQAVKVEIGQGKYPLYVSENRPSWWPDAIPFISPNHPSRTEVKGLTLRQMIEVADNYQRSLLYRLQARRIEATTSDEGECSGSHTIQESHNVPKTADEALCQLSQASSWEQFCELLPNCVLEELFSPLKDAKDHVSFVTACPDHPVPDKYRQISIGPDVSTAVSFCMFGTDKFSKHLRLAGLQFGMKKYSSYVKKFNEIELHLRANTIYALSSPSVCSVLSSGPQDKLVETFLQEELQSLVKDSHGGVFQLLLVAGAMEVAVIQHDILGTTVHECVLNEAQGEGTTCIHVQWNGWKEVVPSVKAAIYKGTFVEAPDHCWDELMSRCGETCAMEVLNQCAVKFLPGKASVEWVQCSECQKWLHCICTGLLKSTVSGVDFWCCKAVQANSSNNYQLMKEPLPVFLSDVQSLYPDRGISNTVIDFFIRELLTCSTEVVVVSPFVYQGIAANCDETRLKSIHKACCAGDNIWCKGTIAFPCRLQNSWHYILVVVNLDTNRALILDSMPPTPEYSLVVDNISTFLSTIMEKTLSLTSEVVEVPRQIGGTDCGIHVLANLEVVMKNGCKLSDVTLKPDCSVIRKTILAKCFLNQYYTSQNPTLSLRRSKRKPQNVSVPIPLQMLKHLEANADDSLQEVQFLGKGRGVIAKRPFTRGEFICEYVGELLTLEQVKKREPSCYMFYVQHKGATVCIDASKEDGRMGRLINHSKRQANVIPKVFDYKNRLRLCFLAKRDIHMDEELVYDYGDRSKAAIESNPWLCT